MSASRGGARALLVLTCWFSCWLGAACGDAGVGTDAAMEDTIDQAPPTSDAGLPALTIDAGTDVMLRLPANAATLHASTNTPGSSTKFAWRKASGGFASLAGADTDTLQVTGLDVGAFVFTVSATDDRLLSVEDSVQVTVEPSGAVHYVSTTGSDSTGDGSVGKPWASLAKACASVTAAGDLIHVVAGTYNEPSQCVLAPKVSIDGDGKASHLTLAFQGANLYQAALQLSSTTEGTLGDQSISNLWLDGNGFATNYGIIVRARSKVRIHDLTMNSFQAYAFSFNGRIVAGVEPAVYATGNELYANTTTDCSDRASGGGLVSMHGQDGLLIHDNTFNQFGRAPTHNGNVIGAVAGYNRGVKYYNNVSTKPADDGAEWNFAIETWYDQGGMEVYGNTFNGGGCALDVGYGAANKGTYAYSWHVHDNLFQLPAQFPTLPTTRASIGVQFEVAANDAIVEHNHFKNIVTGVGLLMSHGETRDMERVYVHNNLFENMGVGDGGYSFMVTVSNLQARKIDSIFIDNNTMLSGTSGHSRGAIQLEASGGGTISNLYFRNNIVEHVATYGYLTFAGTSTIDSIFTQNNVLYDNVNANAPHTRQTPTVTQLTNTGNIVADPLLDASYHLQAGSPAIGAGLEVGYGTNAGAFP